MGISSIAVYGRIISDMVVRYMPPQRLRRLGSMLQCNVGGPESPSALARAVYGRGTHVAWQKRKKTRGRKFGRECQQSRCGRWWRGTKFKKTRRARPWAVRSQNPRILVTVITGVSATLSPACRRPSQPEQLTAPIELVQPHFLPSLKSLYSSLLCTVYKVASGLN